MKSANRVIPKRVFWWFFYALWIGMIALLVTEGARSRDGGMKAPEELLASSKLSAETVWMGIYIGGQKIGFTHSEIEPLASGGYEIREISRMSGAMMGALQQMKLQMTVITDSALALVAFEGRFDAPPYSTTFKGTHDRRVLKIEMTTAGKTTEKFLPANEPLYLSQAIKPLLQAGRLQSGDSLKLSGFDPVGLQMQDLIIVGADLQIHNILGEDRRARKLITRTNMIESAMFVDEDGETIAEIGPMGITMKRETRQEALASGENAIVDFLDLYAVKPKGSLTAPRKAETVTYRIEGFDLKDLENVSDRQSLLDNNNLRVVRQPSSQSRFQLPDSQWIKAEPFIESDAVDILTTARKVVQGGTDRLDSLNRLVDWVYRHVHKKPSAGLPSALAVLKTAEGDCNEHSVLFTALARSVGIPTRIQMGLVYQNERFYYHAWTASYVNGAWLESDPTFGERIADAARITLATGNLSDAIKIASAIGNIQIEILDDQVGN